jgi:hypothetical protein
MLCVCFDSLHFIFLSATSKINCIYQTGLSNLQHYKIILLLSFAMENHLDSSGHHDSKPSHLLSDVKEASCIRSPFLRPERFCHTTLTRDRLMLPTDYHNFMDFMSRSMSVSSFHISVTDSRATRSRESICL